MESSDNKEYKPHAFFNHHIQTKLASNAPYNHKIPKFINKKIDTYDPNTVLPFLPAAQGLGFIARDLRFMNSAGADGGQAVALLATGDQSVYYRCRIDSYQDSLYAHSNRQFFRECHIYGTIDFICGGASTLIQKSFIFARKPSQGQQNTLTAQNKYDPHCPTGIVIQSSKILPSGNLSGVSTFLGRPWTPYATTLFAENNMSNIIDPKGWLLWNNSTPPNTIFLAEYNNSGDGAQTGKRVNWTGVKYNLSYAAVKLYTARSFIQGDQWLPAAQVPYDPDF